MKMLKTLVVAAGISAIALSSSAQVTINFNADTLRNQLGADLSTTSLVALVVDVDGDGFGLGQGQISAGSSITAGSFIGASNDYIIYAADLTNNDFAGLWAQPISGLQFTGNWSTGDVIGLIWFSGVTAQSSTTTDGASYGFINTGFTTPAAGATVQYQVISTTNTGFFTPDANTLLVSDAQTTATLTVQSVPEPATYLLMALGLVSLFIAGKRYKS